MRRVAVLFCALVGLLTVSMPAQAATTYPSLPPATNAVFNAINQARAAHGVPPLVYGWLLRGTANAHNQRMANANDMEHQLVGEPSLGDRLTAAGVAWGYCEENIGWNSDTSNNGVPGALALHQMMMAEGPPAPGTGNHYSNILSPSVHRVGVNVILDNVHHKIWLTEDFAG